MLTNMINGVRGYLQYKGGAGHISFLMQRISGLGTLAFLSMHILLESTASFAPHLYDQLNAGLRHPIALTAEIFMAFLVIFHGVNGYRIAYLDLFRVDKWALPSGSKSASVTWTVSFILWLPTCIIMLWHAFQRT
jgi:succinate dehydrogenase / fumarate reductase, cytochrome b subunit